MLIQKLHESRHGIVSKVMIGLICVVFGAFGIDAFFSGGNTQVSATVGDEEISERMVQEGIERQRSLLASQRPDLPADFLSDENLRAPVIENLIQRQLLVNTLRESKLTSSKGMVDQFILKEEAFHGEGDKFSPARYEQILQMNNISPKQYQQQVSEELSTQQLRNGLLFSDFVTKAELNAWYRIFGEKRDIYWAQVSSVDADAITVSEAEIKQWFESNPDRYMTEEMVRVEFLELKAAEFVGDVAESDISKRYEKEMAEWEGEPERQAAHIMFELSDTKAEEKAREVSAKLAAGEDFAALAKTYSQDPGSANDGGVVGYTRGDVFPAEFESALKELALGDVSELVKSEAGYHLIKLVDVRKSTPPSLMEVRQRIEADLQQELIEANNTVFVEKVETLANASFNSDGLEEPADELGLSVQKSEGFVSRTNGGGLFANPEVVRTIFSKNLIEEGHNSDVLELADGHVVVLNVVAHKEPALFALADVKEVIELEIQANKAKDQEKAAAETMVSSVNQGSDFSDVAKTNKYEWQMKLQSERFAQGVPTDVLREAFDIKGDEKAKVATLLQTAKGETFVLQIANVTPGKAESIDPGMKRQMTINLTRAQGDATAQIWMKSLREGAEVNVVSSANDETLEEDI